MGGEVGVVWAARGSGQNGTGNKEETPKVKYR